MVLQLSTRQIWASAGPFEQYPISGRPQRNVPAAFLKEASWQCKASLHAEPETTFSYLDFSCLDARTLICLPFL
jgi:hypothetical protein